MPNPFYREKCWFYTIRGKLTINLRKIRDIRTFQIFFFLLYDKILNFEPQLKKQIRNKFLDNSSDAISEGI